MSSPIIESYDPSRHPPIEIVRALGAGSFGVVYLAHFEGYENSPFAMKMAEEGTREAVSLEKEKRVYENLQGCPGITVCFMDATTEDPETGLIYYSLLLEYAPAGTLRDLIKRNNGRGFTEELAGAYTRMILVGLYSMHVRGYIHCDLKPQNILAFPAANGSGAPYDLKLADFGIVEEPGDRSPPEFWKGKWRGTPNYMSPESVNDGLISRYLDTWSLGCVVLQMLNGWESSWLPETRDIVDLLKDPKFDPKVFVPKSTSPTGYTFLWKCLARDPGNRWSAHNLLDDPFLDIDASPAEASSLQDFSFEEDCVQLSDIF